MERKSLVPLAREVVTIVKKTRVSVKEQKKQEKAHKSFFEEGALKRANEISGRLGRKPAVIGEDFDR